MPTTKRQALSRRKPIYEYRASGRIVVGYVGDDGETSVKKPSDLKGEGKGNGSKSESKKKS